MASVVLLAGCADDRHITDGVKVVNHTSEPLHFVLVIGTSTHDLVSTIAPGQTGLAASRSDFSPNTPLATDGCLTGALVALGPDSREIARHDASLCVGDVWTIEGSPASTVSRSRDIARR